jgi:HSP20 family protein
MAIIRRDPRGFGIWNFRDEMDKLFDNFFGAKESETGLTNWFPHTDIEEDKEKFALKMDVPGLKKDDIRITIEENMLTISGDRKIDREEKKSNYHRIERVSGTFSRSFSLPRNVKSDHIEANYDNGVLEIYLPKVEEAKPKEVEIKVK